MLNIKYNVLLEMRRILQVLASMQKITLHALPEDEPWSVEEFVEKTEEACRTAAVDLHRKSLMVEEAVEEVLELVKNAAESFKGAVDPSQFNFLNVEGNAYAFVQ